ncbi:hypothetical protein M422DRAFT_23474 [Sphaerobolus stellatus SS14]|nr:hypothetical protein M422DRAFT_23474 [Sphaerobolus stellatus SS14]
MSATPSNHQLVWVLTGSSAGFGLSLTRDLLERNELVIATARSPERAKDLIVLQAQYPETCRVLQLDVTDEYAKLKERAEEAVTIWGRVDVVVNNAGYSIVGLTEESGSESYHEMFKTNLYGPINVTNAFLPHMRERRDGTVVFVGSRSGWRTEMPVTVADGLSTEVAPFNIRVLNVVPGGLRTDNINHVNLVRGREKAVFTDAQKPTGAQNAPIDGDNAYASPSDAQYAIQGYNEVYNYVVQYLVKTNGSQPGDSDKAARVLVDVVRGEGAMEVVNGEGEKTGELRKWPGTLFLGSDAARDVRAKCDKTIGLLEEWGDIARSIDVDE